MTCIQNITRNSCVKEKVARRIEERIRMKGFALGATVSSKTGDIKTY